MEDKLQKYETHIGAELAAARKSAHISISELARQLSIKPEYIEAVERLDASALPSIGYALGYVRNYARFFNQDPAKTVKRFKEELDMPPQFWDADGRKIERAPNWTLPMGSVALALTFTIMVGFSVLFAFKPNSVSAIAADSKSDVHIKTESLANSTNPTENLEIMPEQVGGQVLEQTPMHTISLKAVSASYVKIQDKDGQVLIKRIMVPGEIFEVAQESQPLLSLRDAGAIELYIGGERIGPIGQKGARADNIDLSEVRLSQ